MPELATTITIEKPPLRFQKYQCIKYRINGQIYLSVIDNVLISLETMNVYYYTQAGHLIQDHDVLV